MDNYGNLSSVKELVWETQKVIERAFPEAVVYVNEYLEEEINI